MKDYRGYSFVTNKQMNCLIVEDVFNNKYVVINMNCFKIIASDYYDNLDNLINTIMNKF